MKTLLIILSLFIANSGIAQVVPLPHAHAHNDYQHERPLLDALSHGFASVEADVLLIDGELYVGHDMPQGKHTLPTLEEAYLKPLQGIVQKQRGKVYPGYEGDFYLMLDFKTEAEATYPVLRDMLESYQDMLSSVENDAFKKGAVTIFLSGNRPIQTVQQENKCYVGIDGRPEDLGKGYSSALMPFVSENFMKVCQWNGEDAIPAQELKKLTTLIDQAHAEDKKLRLWASPDNRNTWEVLRKAKADLINTDKLAELEEFLTQGNTDSH